MKTSSDEFAQVEAQKKFRRVCSWCGKVMEEGDEGADTSHTICESCLLLLEAEANRFWNSEAGVLTRQTVEKFLAPRDPGSPTGQPAASR